MIIVGCSGLGREVAWLCGRNDLYVEGFLDDDIQLHGLKINDIPVLGGIDKISEYSDREFVIAIASPPVRKKLVEQSKTAGAKKFPAIIDKEAIVGDSSNLGEGVIVFPGTIITVNCEIGAFSIINKNCSIGHDASFSTFCTISPMVMTGGYVELGEGVEIGASACLRQG